MMANILDCTFKVSEFEFLSRNYVLVTRQIGLLALFHYEKSKTNELTRILMNSKNFNVSLRYTPVL